ncbi:hypothetical protein SAMN04488104_103726 [Algoriphagus faecimaris]|uniref:LTXXQ motif family protein n=1 Tax=Algoriphagus faecimaris TaxID=686796 RepID=A0A1G6VQB5_9BACT|nr:hypothetical protein [Algoriphagus faecimaris]SDD55731.1 hypothetical protein SAMN04488104_103726 [Algoriphagus faecimaris]
MKKIHLFLIIFLFAGFSGYAQRNSEQDFDPERLKAARIAFITSRLELNSEQAEKFWPVYNEYTEKREANLKQMASLYPRRGQAALSDSDAKKAIEKRFDIQRKMIEDEQLFVNQVSKIISYNQILKLNGIARDFTRMIYQKNRQRRSSNN